MKTKISEVDVLLEQMRSQLCANKQSESYSCLLSDSLEVRGKGKAIAEITKRPKTAKERSAEKSKTKSAFVMPLSHANSINEQLADEKITLLSCGLKFITTPT